MIDYLVEHPRLQEAARLGRAFGRFPDEALDCTQDRWQMRVAGALVLHRDLQQQQTPTGP